MTNADRLCSSVARNSLHLRHGLDKADVGFFGVNVACIEAANDNGTCSAYLINVYDAGLCHKGPFQIGVGYEITLL